jgi:hypothetical protein
MPIKIKVPDSHPHPGLLHTIVVQCDAPENPFFAEGPIVVIKKKKAWRGIASNVDIRPPVLIKICRHYGHSIVFAWPPDSRLRGHIGKFTVTIVVIKDMRTRKAGWKTAGPAIDWHSFPITIHVFASFRYALEVELYVVGNEKV